MQDVLSAINEMWPTILLKTNVTVILSVVSLQCHPPFTYLMTMKEVERKKQRNYCCGPWMDGRNEPITTIDVRAISN